MTQVNDFTIPSSDLDMAELKAKLEGIFGALGSLNRGGTAPSNPFSGMLWIDTSTPNQETLKVYLAGWISLAAINTISGVVSFNLSTGAIGESLIADDSITSAKLAANSVSAAKIANGSVTTDKIADANVTTAKLGGNSVTDAKLAKKATGTILSNISGSEAAPTGNTLSDIIQAILNWTHGSLLYRNASGLMSLPPGTTGQVLKSRGANESPVWADMSQAGVASYQLFTASGTWTKPFGLTSNSMTFIQNWGAGGGGENASNGAGGGGGAYVERWIKTSDLPSTVTVTIGAGGAVETNGGETSFGAYASASGGGGAPHTGVGGGGAGSFGGGNGATPGAFDGGTSGNPTSGGNSIYGGGGGGYIGYAGGMSIWGGGGGGGGTASGGASRWGGAGGGNGAAGSAPGGGGGHSAAGARGECRVTTFY